MAKYTIELGTIHESKNLCVFDFDYNFYEPNLKGKFEQKFIDHYYISEIGFETIGRFKQRLKAKLNLIMPTYRQLYETELKAKDINFLLNKDLKETTIRKKDTEDNSTINTTNSEQSTTNNTTNEDSDFKESNIDNGNSTLSYDDLTSINKSLNNSTSSSSGNSSVTNDSTGKNTGIENEELTLISQGNIGITSSAELLQKWRDVIQNLDQQIIEECRSLFMEVF